MKAADIDIVFCEGRDRSVPAQFQPGGAIGGRISIVPARDLTCKKLSASLVYQVEGQFGKLRRVVLRRELFRGEMAALVPVGFDFHLDLPVEPWSYNGHLMNIGWELEVEIIGPGLGRLTKGQAFLLKPSTTGELP